jgi:hypothetical protein
MVLRLISRSPRGPGSFAPVVSQGVTPQTLAPASGRQDHTTSPSASGSPVKRAARVHRIPLRVRDVAQRPSVGRDAGKNTHFPIFRKRNICAWRTDDSNQLESAHKIRFYAHAIFCPRRRSIAATSSKIQTESPDDGQISCGRAGKRSRSPQAMGRARAQLRPDQS